MARVGARTLYLQTGNYEQRVDLVRPREARALHRRRPRGRHARGRLVPALLPLPGAGHASSAGRDPVPEREGRALRLVRARHRSQPRQIGAAAEHAPAPALRHAARGRRPQLSARRDHPLAGRDPQASHVLAPVPVPVARPLLQRIPADGVRDRRHIRGVRATRAYNAADVAIIRERTGKPHVPIHLIGGIANAMGPKETAGFMQAVADCSVTRLQPVRLLRHETGDLESACRAARRHSSVRIEPGGCSR